MFKTIKYPPNRVILEIRTPRIGEETPEAMAQFFSSLANLKSPSSFFSKTETPLSFEIALFNQTVHFYIVVPDTHRIYVESQILSQYPKATVTEVKGDYLDEAYQSADMLDAAQLQLTHNFIYPLRTFSEFKEVDPIASIVGMLSRASSEDFIVIQFLTVPAGTGWHKKGRKIIEGRTVNKKDEQSDASKIQESYSTEITNKIAYPGFKVGIRILTKSTNLALTGLVANTFSGFSNTKGNSLSMKRPHFWQKRRLYEAIKQRTSDVIPENQILNSVELATMFHLPSKLMAEIPNIAWSKTIISDSPENLPIARTMTEEEKKNMNFFARTDYKNSSNVFGIERNDRRRHMYIIGKTGTGKSTLIANMAINDIRNGEGMAIIDPHGDLSETILEFVPSYRVNDVIYLNPADVSHPFRLNPLEVDDPAQREFVASGIVAIFYKLYGYSWGPRLEYILRNTILTLLQVPDSTLMQIPELLTYRNYRKRVVDSLQDQVLKNFWTKEFEQMSDQQMNEAISPILNKVGQFLSSTMIRNIVASPKSTINLEDAMNQGKIVILNLSQGRVGEDNSALLGAMIITKLQLAAMKRVNMPEDDRRDFYLYVDEFQNFATTSFIKILSEARKYRLNLILANQYTAQVLPEVRSAIFGNAGTMISFLIGAEDASVLAKEFKERFKEEDLLALGNFQMIIKMAIKGLTSAPFFAQSLPLPQSRTQNKEKVIKVSRERYAKPMEAYERSEELVREEITQQQAPQQNRKPYHQNR